jgi:hypothetical protein
MANDTNDLVINETLSDLSGGARVSGVILRVELQCYLLSADDQPFPVRVFNRKLRTIFHVLPEMGDVSRQGTDLT